MHVSRSIAEKLSREVRYTEVGNLLSHRNEAPFQGRGI